MASLLAAFAALTTLAWLGFLTATIVGMRRTPRLTAVESTARTWPRVSLVRPACNEAEALEEATVSALETGYPDLQVVLVDDRSTDATPAIVDALAQQDPRIAALHIAELPDGWLGKLNALAKGVELADGDWLLFADADTHLAAGAVRRAIAWADARGIDFVSVLPRIETGGFLADTVWSAVNGLFAAAVRPWRIESDPKAYAATGAFMLVRRTAFDRTPGFEWLKLEVSDDFGLCLMIKQFGGRAGFLVATDDVRIRWYSSFGQMVRLMQKNFYGIAGRFSLPRCLLQAAAIVLLAVGPWLGLLAAPHHAWAGLVGGVGVAAGLVNGVLSSRWTARSLPPALVPWLGLLLTAYIVARSGVVGAWQGGIIWRGILYPTAELRDAQRVRL